jgi:Rod binding domain-containing protein
MQGKKSSVKNARDGEYRGDAALLEDLVDGVTPSNFPKEDEERAGEERKFIATTSGPAPMTQLEDEIT